MKVGDDQMYGENDNGYSVSILDTGKSDINFYRYGSRQIYEVSYNSDTTVGVKPKSYVSSKREAKQLAQNWLDSNRHTGKTNADFYDDFKDENGDIYLPF